MKTQTLQKSPLYKLTEIYKDLFIEWRTTLPRSVTMFYFGLIPPQAQLSLAPGSQSV